MCLNATFLANKVEKYIQTRKEIHPGRRGSVNVASIGSPRLASPRLHVSAGLAGGGPGGAGRRSSRPHNPAASGERPAAHGGGGGRGRRTSNVQLQQLQQQQCRRLSVPFNSANGTAAGRRVSVSHATATTTAAPAGRDGTSVSGSSSAKTADNSGGRGGGRGDGQGLAATTELSALSQRRASFMTANRDGTSKRVEELSLPPSQKESNKEGRARATSTTAAVALGLAVEAHRKGTIGHIPFVREDTFDPAAGRLPVKEGA